MSSLLRDLLLLQLALEVKTTSSWPEPSEAAARASSLRLDEGREASDKEQCVGKNMKKNIKKLQKTQL